MHPEYDTAALQKKHIPYIGELFLGHVRYGTFGKTALKASILSCAKTIGCTGI